MKKQNRFTEEDLIAAIRTDCRRQATSAAIKLTEVIQLLDKDDHRGALGAFAGLDEEMVGLKVFLTRIAKGDGAEFRLVIRGLKAIRKHKPRKGEH